MQPELTFVSAFLVGLFGSVHCIGMCGGIIGALTLNATDQSASRTKTLMLVLFYNIGRISSYVVAGLLVDRCVGRHQSGLAGF